MKQVKMSRQQGARRSDSAKLGCGEPSTKQTLTYAFGGEAAQAVSAPAPVLFHLNPKSEYRNSNTVFVKEVMSRMASPKDVMKRATELRLKQGMTNSAAMKQAWAEARAAEAKAKAESGG